MNLLRELIDMLRRTSTRSPESEVKVASQRAELEEAKETLHDPKHTRTVRRADRVLNLFNDYAAADAFLKQQRKVQGRKPR